MRVSISAIGSDVVIPSYLLPLLRYSPARLDHPGNFTRERQLPETDPAQLELAQKPARASATETPVAMTAGELWCLSGPCFFEPFISSDLGGCGHFSIIL